ncbi:MAG: HAMP domain-containing sensor histidine kinase [Patescibacteria group bacterium]
MKDIIEHLASNILGMVVGGVLGFLICSMHLEIIGNMNGDLIVTISSFIGLLISIAVIEINKTKLLEKSNAVRNEAIALITHEMRTGLTSTGWAIQLMIQKYGNSMALEDKTNLEVVLDSIHTTVTHSVNLLDISLLDMNKLSLSLAWLPLEKIEKIFNEIIKAYTVQGNKKGIQVISHITLNNKKEVEVDILRLRIILENLFENAIQYSLSDKKVITLDITNDDENLKIKLSDNGIGIPESEQPKIFEEFFRASNARKRLQTGSGIGLYACKQYVMAHKGTIRFESKVNEGTVFYVTIPLKTQENISEFIEKI